ncbi:MAG: DUF4386 family protein [Cytophagaceae bacterium]|nr:MAG: DUF4386 family protein [Cytophagaceae bacterium]
MNIAATKTVVGPQGRTNFQLLARLTGVLFLITYATSIPPVLFFYVPVLKDPAYILGTGVDLGLSWGALFELLLIVANIGSALVLLPVLRRINEVLAHGFVAADSAFPRRARPDRRPGAPCRQLWYALRQPG